MKYKVSKPEDFTDIEDYSFKLSAAYAKLYGDMITLLAVADVVTENLNDRADRVVIEISKEMLEKEVNKYKSDT